MKLDLSNKSLKKIDYLFLKQYLKSIYQNEIIIEQDNNEPIELLIQTICLDNNFLSKLENLDSFLNLKNLSLANNRLVEIKSISKLISLQYVNLLNNSLISLEPFKELKNLTWLNISGNQIKGLDALKSNVNLQYLDASENSINTLCDLRQLTCLNTLNLNGNEINTLKNFPNYLSLSIKNLHLSYNSIDDLNEISYLTYLTELESLCIDNNPCVSYSNYESMLNYRPFVLNWCLNLKILDGITVTQNEHLKAEWLHSQGKGRHFKPGQNTLLIEYLIKNCLQSTEVESSVKTSQDTLRDTLKKSSNSELITSDLISDYHKIMVNNFYSSNDSVNNLDKENLKLFSQLRNSSYVNSRTDPDTDSDREKANKYLEYENRPIKPMDTNAFFKQISEFSELSGEEYEEMKKKNMIRLRAKTSDNLKLPQQKNFSKAPTRQFSLNTPAKFNENKTSRLRKRSKTQEDLTVKKTPVKATPVKKIVSSKSVSTTPQKMRNVYSPVKKLETQKKSDLGKTKNFDEKKEDLSILSMEIQTKIQKQREEMREKRERNLREFKNQLKQMDEEREMEEFTSFCKKQIPIPVNLTFEDRCATKIQAAFRGYLVRKSKFMKPKILFLKYKRLLGDAKNLRSKLTEVKELQLDLIEQNRVEMNQIVNVVKGFDQSEEVEGLKIENEGLKLRVKLLEERIKYLEAEKKVEEQIEFKYKKADENIEPKIEVHPPLKVRLQKLNEKSVALKWNHNPKNVLIEITGYNIYINDELCGTMKSTDTIAAINGIQEEGEYKIYLRAFLGDKLESEKSNCVITRVKKKQSNQNKTQASSSSLDETEDVENLGKSSNLSNLSGLSDRNESIEKKLTDLPFQSYINTSRSFLVEDIKREERNEKISGKPPISPSEKKKILGIKNENFASGVKYSSSDPVPSSSFHLMPRDILVRKSISFDENSEDEIKEEFVEQNLESYFA